MAILTTTQSVESPRVKSLSGEPKMLPPHIIAAAIRYTQIAEDTGHVIKNSQIIPQLYEELGWK